MKVKIVMSNEKFYIVKTDLSNDEFVAKYFCDQNGMIRNRYITLGDIVLNPNFVTSFEPEDYLRRQDREARL